MIVLLLQFFLILNSFSTSENLSLEQSLDVLNNLQEKTNAPEVCSSLFKKKSSLKSSIPGVVITSKCSLEAYLTEDPDLLDKMNKFTEESLVEGIARLEIYNPAIACEFKRKLALTSFVINCDGDTFGGVAAAKFKPHSFLGIGLGKYKFEVSQPGLPNYVVLNAMSKKNPSLKESFNFESGRLNQASSIFHELLHVAGIANQSNLDHNNSQKMGKAEDDLVYTCSNLAFPNPSGGGLRTQEGKLKYISKRQCMTCASFKVSGICAKSSHPSGPEVICKDVQDLEAK